MNSWNCKPWVLVVSGLLLAVLLFRAWPPFAFYQSGAFLWRVNRLTGTAAYTIHSANYWHETTNREPLDFRPE